MSTLLLRLAAPMQAWGVDAKFDRRGTLRVPTKSGVIGMVAAALGRRRNENVADLLAMRFGVRIDREGELLRDYHTAKSDKSAYVTTRYYLADAVFLVGLEGDEELLKKIECALCKPAFPLFLGRRSCPPEGRVSLGLRQNKTLFDALSEEPRLTGNQALGSQRKQTRIVMDADENDQNVLFQRDLPFSFSQAHRRYEFRRVSEKEILFTVSLDTASEKPTEHDPMSELGEE